MNFINTMNQAQRILALAVAAAFVASGCGEAIDIDRVGPNVVDKQLFTGEWYFRSTVVDKQFHTAAVFIGSEGGLERIRWEITEGQLIAHRSYERVPGADPSNPGDQNVLAIFAITKHFDKRRAYNPVNGVETNIIEENDYDRPWWERDYMRVDWSSNLAATYDLSTLGLQGVDRNANNDPTYPWKVRINPDYIETTIDAMVDPDPYVCGYLDQMSPCNGAQVKLKLSFRKIDEVASDYVPLDYPDYTRPGVGELQRVDDGAPIYSSVATGNGQLIPRICSTDETGPDNAAPFLVVEDEGFTRICNTDPFRGDNPGDCVEVAATCANATQSWFRAGPEDSSVPCNPDVHDPDRCFQVTQPLFSRFGYFRTDRYALDRENGSTQTARERLINRWNIWQSSRDDEGRPLPYAAREPKTIVYYLNPLFPPDLLGAVDVLEKDWDTGFRAAVASAQGKRFTEVTQQMVDIRLNDCNIEHVNAFAAEHDLEDALRENNIRDVGYGNLENACAVLEDASTKLHAGDPDVPVFTWQQLGDLRYSFVNWTPKPELAGPLGYGPSAADPITGEIISANANVYGAGVDTYANWGADIVQLLNDELTTEDVVNGTQVREHVEAVRNRWSEKLPASQVNGFRRLFDARTQGYSGAWAPMLGEPGATLSPPLAANDSYLRQVPLTAINANLDKAAASGLEDQHMVTAEMIRMFGNDVVAQREGRVTEQMKDNARPSSWLRTAVPEQARALVQAGGSGAGDASDYAGAEPGVLGLAGKVDEVADYLGRKSFCFLAQQTEPAIADLAAQLKEQGLDREQVVKAIREKVFTAVMAHELGHTFGLRHNFEGSADPLNFFPEFWGVGEESFDDDHKHIAAKSKNPSELRYSSIMDYHQRFNSDFAGIGLYDKAALKMGYAEMVEVFDEGEVNGQFVAREWINSGFILDPYTLPYLLGGSNSPVGGSTADDRINQAYTDTYNAYERGDEYVQLDIANDSGLVPQPSNLYKRRDIPLRDWFHNEMLNNLFLGGFDDFAVLRDNGLLADDGRPPAIAVPYSYCSDPYAWGGSLTCNRYDMGVTSKEIVSNAGEMYEFYYPFDAFRRERVLNPYVSWPASYMNRLYSRTYQPMLNAFRYYYYYRRGSVRVLPAVRDWAEASLIGMNFFTRVLQTPDVGTYCVDDTGTYVPEAQVATCDAPIELGLGQGRMFNSTWDNEYDFRPVNIGSFYDKYVAMRSLTDSDAFFFRDFSQETNRGAFSIGYYRVFQPEILKIFTDLMLGTSTTFTPRVVDDPENPGTAKVNYVPFITTDIYGQPLPPDPDLLAGTPIQPAQSFQMRKSAAFFGMVNLSSTLDQTMDFAARARIAIAGSQSDPVINDPSVPVVTFTDPTAGTVYRAAQIDGPDASVGYQLLSDVKDFAEGPWQDAKDALDAAEGGGNQQAIDAARTAFLVQDSLLQEKVQLIDFIVLAGNVFEFPG